MHRKRSKVGWSSRVSDATANLRKTAREGTLKDKIKPKGIQKVLAVQRKHTFK